MTPSVCTARDRKFLEIQLPTASVVLLTPHTAPTPFVSQQPLPCLPLFTSLMHTAAAMSTHCQAQCF
jgi:hypothetical protein